MEAALVLPVLLIVLALLLQPVCYLYTRCVMQEAASEALRALATAGSSDTDAVRQMVLRRLACIPEVSIFHTGGEEDWTIEVTSENDAGEAEASISGHLKALPLFAPTVAVFCGSASGEIEVKVVATASVKPSWLSGSYSDWTKIWG